MNNFKDNAIINICQHIVLHWKTKPFNKALTYDIYDKSYDTKFTHFFLVTNVQFVTRVGLNQPSHALH